MVLVAPPASANTATTHLQRLPNGLTVLVQEDQRFPLVSLRLYVHAGSSYETDKQAGISHLLEHMVFNGTDKRPAGQAAEDIEKVGGYINAATSFDYTVYIADMPDKDWAMGMDVLKDMAFNATIDPKMLANEKKVVLSELERNEDSPDSMLFKTIQPLIWPDTTYARPIIGYRQTIKDTSSEDIKNYVADLYQPQSALMVVCGNVKAADVVKEAEKVFGGLQNTGLVTPVEPWSAEQVANRITGPVIDVQQGNWGKVYLSVAFPIPGFTSAQAVSTDVLAHLLGGDKTSLLYQKFKYDLQMVDDISFSSLTLERIGMFYLRATMNADKVDPFWKELIKTLAGVSAADFNKADLDRAKLNLEDSLYQVKETLSGLASKVGFFQFFENNYAAETNYIYELRNVSNPQLQELIDTYLTPDHMVSVMLVPGQKENNAITPEVQNAGTANKETAAADVPSAEALKKIVGELWKKPVQKNADTITDEAAANSETIDMGNGNTLVLLPDTTLPYTSVSLMFQGGDNLITAQEQGLSALLARLLTKGTAKRSATQIQEFLAAHAADLHASANREMFTVSAKFPTRFSKDVLGLFQEVLSDPALSQEELQREKQSQVAEIISREDKPLGLAFRHVFPFLFNTPPYTYFHLGTPEGVEKSTREQVLQLWKKQQHQPWVMAVCGDFDAQAIKSVAASLSSLRESDAPEAPSVEVPVWSKEKIKDLTLADRNQTHLLLLFKAPPLNHPDTPALMLLRAALSGQSGLLFSDLRDKKGLGYSVSAFLWQNATAGFLAFYIGTSPDKSEVALKGFDDVVKLLDSEPLPEKDVQRGKNTLVGEYYRDNQSLSSRSSEAALLLTQGFSLDLNRDQLEKVKNITPEELLQITKKYLIRDQAYLMRVQP